MNRKILQSSEPVRAWAGNLRWLSALLHHGCIDSSSMVLDVGCGDGRFSLLVALASGCNIEGTELDRDAAMSAQTRIRSHYRPQGDLPKELGVFDVVYCRDVLPRIENLKSFVKSIHVLLRSGGRFVTVTPDPTDIGDKPLYWSEPSLVDHAHKYKVTTSDLCSVLKAVGFHEIRTIRILLGYVALDYSYIERHSQPGFSAIHNVLEPVEIDRIMRRLGKAVCQFDRCGTNLVYRWERTLVVAK